MSDHEILDSIIARKISSFENDRVNLVKDYKFYKCTSLENLSIPNATSIGSYAFASCSKLKTFVVPANITYLGTSAFQGCANLTTLKISSNTIPFSAGGTYSGDYNLRELILTSSTAVNYSSYLSWDNTGLNTWYARVYVPDNLIDEYQEKQANKNWPSSATFAPLSQYPLTELGTITDDWETILNAEKDGTYLTKYAIGDTKSVVFNNAYIRLEIIGFDKDDLADGSGKAHITWLSKDCIYEDKMNNSNTTNGGWAACALRSKLINQLNACDQSFRTAVKEVNKTYYNYYTSSTETIADNVWIPSVMEMNFSASPIESSGVIYDDVFTSNANRAKISQDSSHAQKIWWLRSAKSAMSFYTVYTDGSSRSTDAKYNYGVVVGFCT